MGTERLALQERRRVVEERLGDAVADHHTAEGRISTGEALRERDHVGLVAVALTAEHVPEAAERGDDLVADEEHVVLVADLADSRPVALGRGERAAGVLHRLHEHRGHAVGPLHLDAQRQVVGASEGARAEVHAVVAAVAIRGLHLHGARHERLERRLDGGDAREAERPHRGAVVGEVPRDDLGLAVLPAQLPVLARQLDRRLDGVAARWREERPVQVAGRVLGQTSGQGDRRLVRERPHGEVGERLALGTGGFGELGAAVADLHGEQPRQAVEELLAVLVVHVAALATSDDGHLVVVTVRPEAGEVHPEVALGLLGERGHG